MFPTLSFNIIGQPSSEEANACKLVGDIFGLLFDPWRQLGIDWHFSWKECELQFTTESGIFSQSWQNVPWNNFHTGISFVAFKEGEH